jgi:hypothetical protein
MSDNRKKKRSEADAKLEREVRQGRKFTLEEAIGRMAGPGAMKGASPVTRRQQTEFAIASWLRSHLADAGGPLEVVLLRRVKGSELLLKDFDEPLAVLGSYCQRLLGSDFLLREFVREVDVEWGQAMGERPYFEIEGSPSHPEDPHTFESVRDTLSELVRQLAVDTPPA